MSMGFVFHDRAKSSFILEDELLFAIRNFVLMNADAELHCTTALSALGLGADFLSRAPFSLSMGEARRVALASVLVHQPDAFLLDEPTAGLDAFGFDVVQSLLLRLKSQRKTILFASHDMELVGATASRVIVLADGIVKSEKQITDRSGQATATNT